MPLDHLTALERISVLETRGIQYEADMREVKDKLDELIQLKSKGIGAFWLVSLIVGTGLLGLLSTVMGFFNAKPHL